MGPIIHCSNPVLLMALAGQEHGDQQYPRPRMLSSLYKPTQYADFFLSRTLKVLRLALMFGLVPWILDMSVVQLFRRSVYLVHGMLIVTWPF